MFSGTSTGSLLSGAMAVYDDEVNPKDKLGDFKRPKYWGSEATSIYQDAAPMIFRSNGMGIAIKILAYMGIIIFVSGACFLMGNFCYNRQKKIDAFLRVEKFLLE